MIVALIVSVILNAVLLAVWNLADRRSHEAALRVKAVEKVNKRILHEIERKYGNRKASRIVGAVLATSKSDLQHAKGEVQ